MYSLNKTNEKFVNMDEEIDLKDLFQVVRRYKKSIIIVAVIITILSIIYTYFATSVYEARLTLQTQQSTQGSSTKDSDLVSTALDTQGIRNIDDEIELLQSYSVVQSALKKVYIGTRYYTTSNLRKIELYNDSPFSVDANAIVERLIDYEFVLEPMDSKHFRLSIAPTLKMKIINFFRQFGGAIPKEKGLVYFSGVYEYETVVSSPYFRLSVHKHADLSNPKYSFTIVPNEYMAEMILNSLKVSAVTEKSSIIVLTYDDNIPERAQSVLNAIAEAYKTQSVETKISGAKKTLSFIDNQLKGINDALQSSATNLQNYKSSHIVIDVKDKATMAAQKLDTLDGQLYDIQMQQSVLKNLLTYLQNNREITGVDVSSTANSTTILSLIEKINAANLQHTSLMAAFTEKHPSVIQSEQQLDSLKASLRETIESSLRGLEQRKSTLSEIIDKNKAALEAIPEQEKELSQLSNNFAVNQKVYEYLLQKRAETAIVESSTASSVRIVDQALVGAYPIKPKSMLIILVGMILGLIAGIVQAFIRNFILNTIQTINDVRKHTSLPLVSVLPYFSNKRILYEDALRKLLTKIKSMSVSKKIQVIAFTSSIYGEGKTTTAIEFAKVIAKTGKKVILLDMDMRRANVHTLLNIPNAQGVITYLAEKSTLEESIQHLQPKLDVMSAGICEASSYDLISSDRFLELVATLRGEYDYIIFISPPSGIVADALVLMEMSDMNLVIFRAEYSKKDFVSELNIYSEEHDLPNVCVVLNGLELSKVRPWRKK
jgi:capsular exopolysaccharide synthesis family protein